MPAPAAARTDRVRLVILVYRKDGMSVEEFGNYWSNEHSKTFSNLAVVKKHLLGYEQAHRNQEQVDALDKIGWPCSDADGMAIFEAATSDDIWECFKDEEYIKTVIPDEEKFLNKSKSVAFPATIVSVIDKTA